MRALAVRQSDPKALVACLTISQLGLITMMFGFGTEVVMAAFHILDYAAFKAGMFLAFGIVAHEVGSAGCWGG